MRYFYVAYSYGGYAQVGFGFLRLSNTQYPSLSNMRNEAERASKGRYSANQVIILSITEIAEDDYSSFIATE